MKFKKHICLLLIIASIFVMVTACSSDKKSSSSSINPKLIEIFGEDFINSEKENIESLVAVLEDCYNQYQKDKDVYAFCANLEKGMAPYEGYLKEISDELMNMYKNEEDQEKKLELMSIHGDSIAYLVHENSWSMYKFCIDDGMPPIKNEADVKQDLIDYINDISQFFYCKKIAK